MCIEAFDALVPPSLCQVLDAADFACFKVFSGGIYGDYIEGLEEDFWLILEYYGKDFAQPKMKQSAIMMECHNRFTFPPSIPLQQFNYPQQNETPIYQ